MIKFPLLLCASANGSTPEPIYYNWGRPLWANVMPFQEDSGLEDVPSLLRNGNVAITPWTAQQHFFLFKQNGVLIGESVENTAR